MTISELIELVGRRLVYLSQLHSSAEALGDIDRVLELETQIQQTQATLDALRTLGG